MELTNDGVYLCLRLADKAAIGDTIEFSPYGSEETYKVKVAGYVRSLMSECIMMTDEYAAGIGLDYHIGSIYTDRASESIEESSLISGKQDKDMIMDTYDTFMEIMNLMVLIFVVAAIVLGTVVLYNLGVMSYVERYRELATLKVLGYRDKRIGGLLISQNIWLTVIGVLIGLPAGVGVLHPQFYFFFLGLIEIAGDRGIVDHVGVIQIRKECFQNIVGSQHVDFKERVTGDCAVVYARCIDDITNGSDTYSIFPNSLRESLLEISHGLP